MNESMTAAEPDDDSSASSDPATALSTPVPVLVPRQITAAKLAQELADWDANAAVYERRGWLLLQRSEQSVVVGFVAIVPIAGAYAVPVITACVHVDYTNYDLWPPSVTFVDPCTRQPTSPAVRAPQTEAAGVRDALVDGHPETGRPFLCLPGVREYHQHPQHTGDDWLLHRAAGAGRLAVLCERIWQRMVRNVLGLGLNLQTLPAPMGTQLEVRIAQGLPPPISGPAESTQPVDSSLRSSRGGDGEPAASQEGLNDEQ